VDAVSSSLDQAADTLARRTRDGTLERMAQHLGSTFPVVRHLADDAVASAVERTLARAREREIEHPLDYVFISARNALRRAAKRSRREASPSELVELRATPFEPDVHSEAELDRVRAGVATWKNANIRAVMLVVIDAAREGEYLTLREITDAASATLDEPLAAGSVKTWKRRGIKKLVEQFNLHIPDDEET